MRHTHLLVIDVETVPDRNLLPTSDHEAFPKPLHHKIVVISFLLATIERTNGFERYQVEECRSGGTLIAPESELLRGFWSLFERKRPRVVTWNGRGFDIPVLVQRAFLYGIPMRQWYQAGDKWNTYRARYAGDWSCDLMDELADYGASPKLGLHETAIAVGLPGKLGGHGVHVEEMIERGQLEQVRGYCECDVLNLAILYFRWAYVTGRTDAEGYEQALSSTIALLERELPARPHFREFRDRWLTNKRPIVMPHPSK